MISLRKYFINYILDRILVKYEVNGECDFTIHIKSIQEGYEHAYPEGQDNKKKTKHLNLNILKGVLEEMRDEGVIQNFGITKTKDGEPTLLLLGGLSPGKGYQMSEKWKNIPILTKDVLMEKLQEILKDPTYREINIKRNENGEIKQIITEKYESGEEVVFVDLKKKYPNASIEATVFAGKVQYYKIKEKLQ